VLGELLPADVPEPVADVGERFPHLHMDHPLDMALRRMAQSKLNVLPVVGRTDIRDLKGRSLAEGHPAGVRRGGRKRRGAAGESEETSRIPQAGPGSNRGRPGGAAGNWLPQLLLPVGKRRSAPTNITKPAMNCCSRIAMTKPCSSSATRCRRRPANPQYRLALGLALAEGQPSCGGFRLFECAFEARSGECAGESGRGADRRSAGQISRRGEVLSPRN
jgi:hypothetical protein